MKKLVVAFVLFTLTSVLVVACSGNTGGGSNGGTDVHMGDVNFVQPSVTIQKGGRLNLIDDVAVVHIIENGSWVNGESRPAIEKGAPTVSNLQFNGNDSQTVGPFNTAGTYHLYCTVHEGMNLMVVVQ